MRRWWFKGGPVSCEMTHQHDPQFPSSSPSPQDSVPLLPITTEDSPSHPPPPHHHRGPTVPLLLITRGPTVPLLPITTEDSPSHPPPPHHHRELTQWRKARSFLCARSMPPLSRGTWRDGCRSSLAERWCSWGSWPHLAPNGRGGIKYGTEWTMVFMRVLAPPRP